MKNIKSKEEKELASFLEKIRTILDPSVVKVQTRHYNGIVFTFLKSKHQVVVSPREALHPYYAFATTFYENNLTLCYDKDYQILKKLLKNQKIDTDKDPNDFLYALVNSFKKKSPKSKKIDRLPYSLRKEAENYLGLEQAADREFFVFGNREIRPRYKESNIKITKLQNIQIQDDSALIFYLKDGSRVIDLSSCLKYADNKYLYLDNNLTKNIQVKEGEKYSFVQLGEGPGNRKYFKVILKKGIDLKKLTNKIKYTKANKKIFKLIKVKNKFFLEDDNGLIGIGHPDLLICVLPNTDKNK